jgi:hypothetical protein
MYYSIGGDAIIPVFSPVMVRIHLLNVALHNDGRTIDFGAGIGTDVMYYMKVSMAFTPYGFGGLG